MASTLTSQTFPPPPTLRTIPSSQLIIAHTDPVTREVKLIFPTPEGDVLKPEIVKGPNGEKGVLRFDKATLEQKAHHVFWSNGTHEQIDELIQQKRGAGLRQTLKWVIDMRITVTKRQTGFQYYLVMFSNQEKLEAFLKSREAA